MEMTTLSMISVTCPRGKGGENSIFKLRYESFATSTVFRGFCKSSDRVWFRNLEGCSPRNRHKFFVAAMTNKGNKPEYFSYEKPLFQMDKKIAKVNWFLALIIVTILLEVSQYLASCSLN